VWHNPELFHLDENLRPTVVSGVPPDAFSATGQRWGNPIYRWDTCRTLAFQWWTGRIAWALETCDILRLDHFRAFESYWEIPAWEETAIRGQWKKGPQDELFCVLRDRLGDLPFIAEDLGYITPEVHAMRDRLGIPGMKVLQFAFGDPGARIYLPHNYPLNCVVYSGTHDNDTTLGWWRSGASKEERTNIEAYLGPMNDAIPWALIRLAFSSVARMAVVPLQDVLGLSSDARMNTPARIRGNWGWRFTRGALTNELSDELATLTTMCDRAPEQPPSDLGEGEAREDFTA
jgi:4-alpha-glucanotransferase